MGYQSYEEWRDETDEFFTICPTTNGQKNTATLAQKQVATVGIWKTK